MKTKSLLLLALIAVFLTSCGTIRDKETYLSSFESYVNSIDNRSHISDKEWKTIARKHQKYIGDRYKKYRDEFNASDYVQYGKIEARFAKIYAKRKVADIGNAIGGVKDIINEAKDAVDDILGR